MRRITKHSDGQPWGASWFPDGQRIAYSHEDRLIVRDLESGAERVFLTPVAGRLVRTQRCRPTAGESCSRSAATARGCSTSERGGPEGARGPDRRGIHVVARRQAAGVLQPPVGHLGRLGDGPR